MGEFLTELKKLSEPCKFGAFLDEHLKDIFVCGLKSISIQKKLMTERDLTLDRAYQVAAAMEAAGREVNELQQAIVKVQKMKLHDRKQQDRKQYGRECARCGKSGHSPDRCFYKNAKCHNCSQVGHLSRKCPSKPTGKDADDRKTQKVPGKMKKKSSKVKHLQTEHEYDSGSDSDADDEVANWPVFSLKSPGMQEIMVPLKIEDQDMAMELDTGSCRSVISEKMYQEKFTHLPLKDANAVLTTYTGQSVPVLGEILVNVKSGTDKKQLPLVVCSGQGPPLLGRDWLFEMKLNWQQLKRLHQPQDTAKDDMMSKYASLFDGSLGTVKGVTAKLKVRDGATPKFFKPRPVPYAMKDKISDELDRLETDWRDRKS